MALSDHGHSSLPLYKTPLSPRNRLHTKSPRSSLAIRMAPGDYEVSYDALNIGGREDILSIKYGYF